MSDNQHKKTQVWPNECFECGTIVGYQMQQCANCWNKSEKSIDIPSRSETRETKPPQSKQLSDYIKRRNQGLGVDGI